MRYATILFIGALLVGSSTPAQSAGGSGFLDDYSALQPEPGTAGRNDLSKARGSLKNTPRWRSRPSKSGTRPARLDVEHGR